MASGGDGKFAFRRPITIDGDEVGCTDFLYDFPVLVSLSGDWLRTTPDGDIQHSSGYDIVFRAFGDTCDDEGSPCTLDHEIEYYGVGSVEILDNWQGVTDFLASGMSFDPSAGSNRLVLIAVFAEEATATVSVDTVSLDGVALTKIDEQVVGTGYSNNVWLGYLKDADIPAGTAITVTWVGNDVPDGPNGDPIHVQAATLQNVDQTTPVGNKGKQAATSASSIGSSAGMLNVADGDMVVYATIAGQPGNHTEETGYTEHLEQDGDTNNFSDATASKAITGTGTEEPVAAWSPSTRLAIITAVIKADQTGSLVAWVRVPKLYSGSNENDDTVIYIYYGNDLVTAETENPTGVWDSNYRMVQHMNDATSSTIEDSTSYNNNGTKGSSNNPDEVSSGKIGNAQDFDSNSEYITLTDSSTWNWSPVSQARTLSFWFRCTARPTIDGDPFQFIVTTGAPGNRYQALYGRTSDPLSVIGMVISDNSWNAIGYYSVDWDPTLGTWYHITLVASSAGNNKIFIDGVDTSVTEVSWDDSTTIYPSSTGIKDTTGASSGSGYIDEMRFSHSIRDVCWIQTSYNNQSDTAIGAGLLYPRVGRCAESDPPTAVGL